MVKKLLKLFMVNIMKKNNEKIEIKPHGNWMRYKYEMFNNCPYCNGKITMIGCINEFQDFECFECGKKFTLNAINDEITLKEESNNEN